MQTHVLPWWQSLPADFGCQAISVDDPQHPPFLIKGSAAMDLLLRTLLSMAAHTALLPHQLNRAALTVDLQRLSYYADAFDRSPLEALFPAPPSGIAVASEEGSLLGYKPAGIPSRRLVFDSPFRTAHPALQTDYARHSKSHKAVAQHWTHPDGPRPTLIFTHGFVLDPYWINVQMFALRWFYDNGYDIFLYTMPFHGSRRSSLSIFSGQGYLSDGLCHLNEAVFHSVFDLRVYIQHLRSTGVESIGLAGLSLGAYVSSMVASVEENLAFCISNASPVSLFDVILGWWPLAGMFKRVMAENALEVSDLRKVSASHCALSWRPKLSADRLLVIGGAGDRFVLPQLTRLLHEHWEGSTLHWHPGNHVLFLRRKECLNLMLDFMNRTCDR